MGIDPYPISLHDIPARTGHKSYVVFCLILLIIFLPISFLPFAFAATKESKAPKVQNPKVVFLKGLLTVEAKDLRIKVLMEEIGKKAGIEVSIAENLQKKKVSVQFEKLTLEAGLKAILQSAGIVNHALVYKQSKEPGKVGKWVIEKIYLKEKGTSKDALSKAKVGQISRKTGLDKEPFFDKRLDRFVEVVKGEVMVKFRKGITDEEIGKILKDLGASVIKKNDALNIYRLKIPQDTNVFEFIDKHGKNENLRLVEPNFITSTLTTQATTPNDPSFLSQWAIPKIEADKAWSVTTGSPEVVVAILDTGIDMGHKDLINKIHPGYDIVNNDPDPTDDNGHGTHVAGIVAAEANNNTGIAGISWESLLMPVKVITASGEGAYSDVIDGITYAADNGARILNLSIGGYSYSQTLADAVEYAHTKGAVLVAAGGNEDSSDPIYPAAYANVIGVSATDSSDQIWAPSNQGSYVKISAPGTDILSSAFNNGYAKATGTSASTAHVSGVAALIFSKNPDFSNTQVEQLLYQTADDLGDKGLDQYFGYGRVNASKALDMASIEVHDVAVTGIRVEPQSFNVGETTQIIVTVQNQGTFVEKDLSVTISVNDVTIESTKKIISIKPGEDIDASFSWIPTIISETINFKIKGEVSTVDKEVDIIDNDKTKDFAGTLQHGIVAIKHKTNPPVHQHIANEAYKLSPDGPMKAEIGSNLGIVAYYGNGNTVPFVGTDNFILEGVSDEDESGDNADNTLFDPEGNLCSISGKCWGRWINHG